MTTTVSKRSVTVSVRAARADIRPRCRRRSPRRGPAARRGRRSLPRAVWASSTSSTCGATRKRCTSQKARRWRTSRARSRVSSAAQAAWPCSRTRSRVACQREAEGGVGGDRRADAPEQGRARSAPGAGRSRPRSCAATAPWPRERSPWRESAMISPQKPRRQRLATTSAEVRPVPTISTRSVGPIAAIRGVVVGIGDQPRRAGEAAQLGRQATASGGSSRARRGRRRARCRRRGRRGSRRPSRAAETATARRCRIAPLAR